MKPCWAVLQLLWSLPGGTNVSNEQVYHAIMQTVGLVDISCAEVIQQFAQSLHAAVHGPKTEMINLWSVNHLLHWLLCTYHNWRDHITTVPLVCTAAKIV